MAVRWTFAQRGSAVALLKIATEIRTELPGLALRSLTNLVEAVWILACLPNNSGKSWMRCSAPEIGQAAKWEPFDLDEGLYWAAGAYLENLTPEQLSAYAHLKVRELKQDWKTDAKSFAQWIASKTS
jgi:hypothetical protein